MFKTLQRFNARVSMIERQAAGIFEWTALLRTVNPRLEKIGAISLCYVIFNASLGFCILIPQFIQPALSEIFEIDRFPFDRQIYIILIATFILYPLCLLKDLSSLRFSSIIGIVAIFYCDGLFVYESIEYRNSGGVPGTAGDPDAEIVINEWSVGIFIVVNVASKALACHSVLPAVYESLRNRSPKRMWIVMIISYFVLTVVYVTFAICGYYLFGTDAQGNVLENFRGQSGVAVSVARLGTAFSIITCFPLPFKAGINALETQFFSQSNSRWNWKQNPKVRVCVITTILVILTLISCFIDDIGPVSSVEGAVTVLLLICAFPILIYWKTVFRKKSNTMRARVEMTFYDATMGEETQELTKSERVVHVSNCDTVNTAEITDESPLMLKRINQDLNMKMFCLGLLFALGIGMGGVGLIMSVMIM